MKIPKIWVIDFLSKNLAKLGSTLKYKGSKACGESSEPCKVQRASKKHEINKLSNKLCRNARYLKNLYTW